MLRRYNPLVGLEEIDLIILENLLLPFFKICLIIEVFLLLIKYEREGIQQKRQWSNG